MKTLSLFLFLAACAGESGTEYPIDPGGSAGTTGQGSSGSTTLSGRVCVLDNLRSSGQCAASGAGGLAVTLADQIVLTQADGSFEMDAPSGEQSGLSFTVSGAGIVPTSQLLNSRAQVNALSQATYEDMVLATGLTPSGGTGSIIANVTGEGGTPFVGVSGTSAPVGSAGPFFDGDDAEPWTTNATGASGIVWFPGVAAGPADLSFTTLTGGEAIVGGVQVINGGITMVETPLP